MRQLTKACQQSYAPIVLLFTKKDLFMRNLNDYSIPNHLPDISESTDPNTFSEDTLRFSTAAFQSLDHRAGGEIYVYWINAIDTGEVAAIFQDMRENVFERHQACDESSTGQQPRR